MRDTEGVGVDVFEAAEEDVCRVVHRSNIGHPLEAALLHRQVQRIVFTFQSSEPDDRHGTPVHAHFQQALFLELLHIRRLWVVVHGHLHPLNSRAPMDDEDWVVSRF